MKNKIPVLGDGPGKRQIQRVYGILLRIQTLPEMKNSWQRADGIVPLCVFPLQFQSFLLFQGVSIVVGNFDPFRHCSIYIQVAHAGGFNDKMMTQGMGMKSSLFYQRKSKKTFVATLAFSYSHHLQQKKSLYKLHGDDLKHSVTNKLSLTAHASLH